MYHMYDLYAVQVDPVTGLTSTHDMWYVFDRYGLPVLLLVILGGFGYKTLWPFLVKQLEDAKSDMKVQSTAFLAALTARDNIMKCELEKLHDVISENFEKLHARLERIDRLDRLDRGGVKGGGGGGD